MPRKTVHQDSEQEQMGRIQRRIFSHHPQMTTPPPASRRLVATLLLHLLLLAGDAVALPPIVGVAPQDEEYFSSEVIACRDGSGSFRRSRLNDGFCDCADGTDEPGTSACPEGKFYCRNIGDSPRFLFSSLVNDQICDCCDGSDEYYSGINCPNTCRKIKDVARIDNDSDGLSVAHLDETDVFASKRRVDLEDLIQKLRGLRIAVVIELGLVVCIFVFCLAHRRTRSRRRQYILKS